MMMEEHTYTNFCNIIYVINDILVKHVKMVYKIEFEKIPWCRIFKNITIRVALLLLGGWKRVR